MKPLWENSKQCVFLIWKVLLKWMLITSVFYYQICFSYFLLLNVFFSFQIRTSVIWSTPNVSFVIPLWVIILAIMLGLLVLAVLTLALWKVCCVITIIVVLKKYWKILTGEEKKRLDVWRKSNNRHVSSLFWHFWHASVTDLV